MGPRWPRRRRRSGGAPGTRHHHRQKRPVVGTIALWHPEVVAMRTALGKALYGAPEGLRRLLPRRLRDAVRVRLGPFAPWEAGFVPTLLTPPALGPGEAVGPPDFVGIGVQKAGTTWWYSLIVAHPDVSQPATVHKERHFFAPYATRGFGSDDVRGYHQWFPRPAAKLAGEWTPDYIYQPWVPALLQRAAPEARVLVMVRDPIERFVSGLAHNRLMPGSHLGTVVAEAVDRGFYGAALQRWAPWFETGRVL